MENWGLVTYRESNLLYDPVTSSNRNKETTATIIAHELAHMVNTFYNVILNGIFRLMMIQIRCVILILVQGPHTAKCDVMWAGPVIS